MAAPNINRGLFALIVGAIAFGAGFVTLLVDPSVLRPWMVWAGGGLIFLCACFAFVNYPRQVADLNLWTEKEDVKKEKARLRDELKALQATYKQDDAVEQMFTQLRIDVENVANEHDLVLTTQFLNAENTFKAWSHEADANADKDRTTARNAFRIGTGLALAGIVIGCAVAAGAYFFPPAAPDATRVAIPNVTGDSQSDATIVLQEAGLRAVFTSPASSPAGTVASEQPSPGAMVKEDSSVTVTLTR